MYDGTYVFDNDFAALQMDGAVGAMNVNGLLRATAEQGICRVICFSPRHDLSLAELPQPEIRRVVDTWVRETEALGARAEIQHVQIFENKGEIMGCSNPHPHGQIWAQGTVPEEVAKEVAQQRSYYAQHGRTLLTDYLALEEARGDRLVCQNAHFTALVPFWAVWPFETLVIARRPVGSLPALSDAERDGLADILGRLTARYDNLFDVSFPYSAGVHQAPTDGAAHPECHLHLHFYPPLLRSASVKKFMVGYEMLGMPQRDITPESSAERLRGCSEVHFTRSTPR
jgi:UDPglucose--hexose-1-phosphate uridylyltransferase